MLPNQMSIVLFLAALAANAVSVVSAAPAALGAVAGDSEVLPNNADGAAIRAMQGEYAVSFDFRETVVLSNDYQRRQDQRSGAREVVILIEDSPRHIVLQHLLVARDGGVTKHWRQDWTFEADRRFKFVADQTWRLRALRPEETSGRWTQCVFEVSDAPRYCGTGAWRHKYGNSTWTSDRSWRPLPRREHTTRADYNALNVENRHTITPTGWTHEQDNSKVLRDGERTKRVLVREFGFNDYRRTTDTDFGPAYSYWRATAPFWAKIRARWDEAFAGGGLTLNTEVGGMPIILALFDLAKQAQGGETVDLAAVEQIFGRYVRPLPGPAATQAQSP